jgi:hypothetical protein
MSAEPSGAVTGKRRRWGLMAGGLVVSLMLLGAAGWFLRAAEIWKSPEKILRDRFQAHLAVHMASGMQPGDNHPLPERGRRQIIRAIWGALHNQAFHEKHGVVPQKLQAIVERLDATQGEDLKSFEGCVKLLQMCDEASPYFHEYQLVALLPQAVEEAWIPPIPKLGERWTTAPPAAGR